MKKGKGFDVIPQGSAGLQSSRRKRLSGNGNKNAVSSFLHRSFFRGLRNFSIVVLKFPPRCSPCIFQNKVCVLGYSKFCIFCQASAYRLTLNVQLPLIFEDTLVHFWIGGSAMQRFVGILRPRRVGHCGSR